MPLALMFHKITRLTIQLVEPLRRNVAAMALGQITFRVAMDVEIHAIAVLTDYRARSS